MCNKTTVAKILLVGLCICVLGCPDSQSVASDGRSLEDAVRENLDWAKFDKTKLDDHALVVVASGAGRRVFTRDNIEAFHVDAQKENRSYLISKFKVLKKDESSKSRFATITYQVTWNVSGGSTKTIDLVSREVWERQIDGWHRLFAAME
jgi:hypothetical protein